MKQSQIAVVAAGLAIMAAFLAYPALASTASANGTSSTSSSSSQTTPITPPSITPGPMHQSGAFFGGRGGPFIGGNGGRGGFGHGQAQSATFTTGQTITLTSTSGTYFVVGTRGQTNGTASGTLTFTVAGKVSEGYVLSIGGSVTIAGTTYNVTSGSAVMGVGGANIQGEGATSSSGTYVLTATARGDFSGTTTSNVSLDFSNGTTEYAVLLTATITG